MGPPSVAVDVTHSVSAVTRKEYSLNTPAPIASGLLATNGRLVMVAPDTWYEPAFAVNGFQRAARSSAVAGPGGSGGRATSLVTNV